MVTNGKDSIVESERKHPLCKHGLPMDWVLTKNLALCACNKRFFIG